MKKIVTASLLFTFYFLLFTPFCSAQNRSADSLLGILKTEKGDTNKVKTLNALGGAFYRNNKYDSSLFYSKQPTFVNVISFPFVNEMSPIIVVFNEARSITCSHL